MMYPGDSRFDFYLKGFFEIKKLELKLTYLTQFFNKVELALVPGNWRSPENFHSSAKIILVNFVNITRF